MSQLPTHKGVTMVSRARRSAPLLGALGLLVSTAAAVPAMAAPAAPAARSTAATDSTTYLVLAEKGADEAAVRAAITAAGGKVTHVNTAIGLYTVDAPRGSFAKTATDAQSVRGVASNRVIGRAPHDAVARTENVEKALDDRSAARRPNLPYGPGGRPLTPVQGDPLSGLQWDMAMIDAWRAQRYATGRGVKVGIMDTGVDASHPDIAPRFDYRLSRNFTKDDPSIDGSCESDPDGSCDDPATVDENEHGTHVAGTIASPRNGIGIVGVAPEADIVNLRVGQDSGYFFLAPTVDALTYAGDHGIDVVNMSYYIDPWLFNCASNPADSAQEQAEQRTIIEATNRALDYARGKGVTLVAAAGNEHTDLDHPTVDATSPDLPADAARTRQIDNTCLSMPSEGNGVLGVSSVGPTGLKADYSNWGAQAIGVAAPGGYYRDNYNTPAYMTPGNLILAPMPKALAQATGDLDPATGASTSTFIVSQCPAGKDSCAYYQYLQGTSMASPHAAGVAALAVSRWGKRDRVNGGLTLDPAWTVSILKRTATNTICPAPVFDYPDRPDSYTATCTGTIRQNSFYGEGIVDALAAVTRQG